MIKRFQIQDILAQDSSGITFLALDSETDTKVAVRRFFPYGADGGGLHREEQAAYNIAVDRLTGVRHPALRAVVCGGCDPVDGIPYIATEWIDGGLLHEALEQGPLTAEVAIHMLTQLLEVCELLSHVLAEEAIWVETGLHTIVDGDDVSRRGFTFWISPLKWLGVGDQTGGFGSVITLTEEIMGWKGRPVHDRAGQGLAAWLKWLRATADSITLTEAREMLAASVGSVPPAPTKRLVASSITRPLQPSSSLQSQKKTFSIRMWLIFIGVVLVFGGLGGCWWVSHYKYPEISNFRFSLGKPDLEPLADSPEVDALVVEAPAEAVIQWDNREALIQQAKQPITLEGVARGVGTSESGKTIYLLFAPADEKEAVRVGLEIKDVYPETIRENLKYFVDKKVRVSGKVEVRKYSGNDRLEVVINNLLAIRITE